MATVEELQAEIAKYEAARDKIFAAQSYRVGEMELNRPNIVHIEKKIIELRFAVPRMQG